MLMARLTICGVLVLLLEIQMHMLQQAAAATWSVEALPDPDIGKALGVRLAIQFALDMGFFVIFEGDSLNVVSGFYNLSNNQSYFGILLVDCNRLSSRFNSFSLSHVKRSANMAAHFFSAKFALTSSVRLQPIWLLYFILFFDKKNNFLREKLFPNNNNKGNPNL